MEKDLLWTKLQVPRPRAGRVERRHLLARLDSLLPEPGGWRRKVTLVSAPAGYGKTTLLSAWQARAPCRVAWLSLESGDDDLPRFLTYLVAALQEATSGVGKDTLALLSGGQSLPVAALLGPLLNELAGEPAALALILDDYHTIQAEAIHRALTFFVEHQPPQLHLAILTREDPPLPLARWRAVGALAEIRQEDLRFSEAEATTFLQEVVALPLSIEQVAALETRTEGWIAGLQLAALALKGCADADAFVESFAGSNRYVLDYLLEEVFGHQPAAVREFLLATSILERFTAPLCAAVMATLGGPEADWTAILSAVRSHLTYLDRANLFVVALDDRREWFRYHHLFAELLRHQLRLRGLPLGKLHRAAGEWFLAQQMMEAATEQFLAGGAWQQAATVIEQQSDRLLKQGACRTLLRWLRQMPEEVIRNQPQLCLTYAWALIFGGQTETAAAYLQETAGAIATDPELRRGVLEAQAYIARMRHDLPQTISLSRQALALPPAADASERAVLALGLGLAYWQSGQPREAEEVLLEAIEAAERSHNQYAQLVATGFLGTVRATLGGLQEATQMLEDTVRRVGQQPPAAIAYHVLGALLYEWNDLERAEHLLGQAVVLARRSANAELIEGACRQLARLRQAKGDEAGALAALAEAERAVGDEASDLARSRIADAYVQMALAQGDRAAATYWAGRRSLPVDAMPFYPQLDLTPARLYLAEGDNEAAARHLAKQAERAATAGWEYGLVETRVLQALAAEDETTALSFLTAALTLARRGGYVRTFVDKGEPLAALLRLAVTRGIAAGQATALLAAFDPGTAGEEPVAAHRPPTPLVDPLSEREIEIVTLLARRYTNAEIAETLTVSVNTVKTHLRHIYEKLGVHDRRDAVARARKFNLVPQKR